MRPATCVSPEGLFILGIHKPSFTVTNQREGDFLESLGQFDDGSSHQNHRNFPPAAVEEPQADWIYEIPNPFPFRGTTFIKKNWADARAKNIAAICLPKPDHSSMSKVLSNLLGEQTPSQIDQAFNQLPAAVHLALATSSTDPQDLIRLANLCCEFTYEPTGRLTGLLYRKDRQNQIRAVIKNHALFEALVNNPDLPDDYKKTMVLKPGVQGDSEIVGDWNGGPGGKSHIYEYLRRNSYIPWGHYAANMADDAIRYNLDELTAQDMTGLRHLYYQRTYLRLATELQITLPPARKQLTDSKLEELRIQIIKAIQALPTENQLHFTSTLWGWNFGFDFAPSHYRLHASHQQIHQQFALLPEKVAARHGDREEGVIQSYSCGDLVRDFIEDYYKETGVEFFINYLKAIRSNTRTDCNQDGPASLIIQEDEHSMIFVPKAQTSQWELQMICLQPVGNILEANTATRASLNQGMLMVMKIYAALGARMVTTIEFPKRFTYSRHDQRLLYSFLPKLPESMGAFSEAQLRWINGHYPEDFAAACHAQIKK
ncbi:MAG: hypothetical protein KKB30_14395 [Proteobacteria bacterium]|nr:hypothetical protein [Pseudomonadota bacterium]MBU1717241.1 hypothetical protein [Pseudomonadota bacterium]